MDTAHITSIGINDATGFSNFINNYFKYHHINIYV